MSTFLNLIDWTGLSFGPSPQGFHRRVKRISECDILCKLVPKVNITLATVHNSKSPYVNFSNLTITEGNSPRFLLWNEKGDLNGLKCFYYFKCLMTSDRNRKRTSQNTVILSMCDTFYGIHGVSIGEPKRMVKRVWSDWRSSVVETVSHRESDEPLNHNFICICNLSLHPWNVNGGWEKD